MKEKAFLILFAVLCHLKIIAQAEASNWYFGTNAGLNFNASAPIALIDGQLATDEGCATISEPNGELLFYTDGVKVWDKQHNVMPNGTGLTGDASSTQSAIIVPKPGSESLYYIFTVDDLAGPNGVRYSEVNMNLNNGNGDITNQKNIELNASVTEKITAVKHANGIDYWVVAHDWNNNNFLSYRISASGVSNTPVISAVGQIHGTNGLDSKGYMKISPDANRLAYAAWTGNSVVEIFDFNNATGEVSNPILIDDGFFSQGPASGAYGIEFSPDSQLLYVTDQKFLFGFITSRLFQFDLGLASASDMINSVTTLYENNSSNTILAALQLATDGKIYIAKSQEHFLDVIEHPDEIGFAANYIADAIDLGGRLSGAGLPPFITSFFNFSILSQGGCLGQATNFTLNTNSDINSVIWNFGDGFTSTDINPIHHFENPGTYNITAEISAPGETINVSSFITIYKFPIANTPDNMSICDDMSNDGVEIFDLSLQNDFIHPTSPEISITYHLTESDALNNMDPLESLYENISNPQTIYARVQNISNSDCFDMTSFDLNVLYTPDSSEETIYLCTDQPATLSAGLEFDAYMWSNGETTESITVTSPGTYTVEIQNIYQTSQQQQIICTGNKAFTVIESSEAIITTIEINDWTAANNTITIVVEGIGDYEFSLDNSNYQDSNIFNNVPSGDYTVYVRDKNNCGTVTEVVYVLHYPKFFTPNGDDNNDYWHVKFSNTEPDLEVLIFDRYGKLLKQINANSIGWDGTFNGTKMPSSDYWFVIKRPAKNQIYTGHFSLRR
ncbi:MAG: T9SS type B sorting domain-containing protein [Bacteroidota bacterium]